MDPRLFATMGWELRLLKKQHKGDWELNQRADLMIMQMRNYPKAPDDTARGVIEKSFMANLQWLAEWKRSKLAIVR